MFLTTSFMKDSECPITNLQDSYAARIPKNYARSIDIVTLFY